MARLIAPEQFGVFAVALTVWTILHTLAEFGLGADLVRATDLERRAPTVATIGLLAGGLLALSMALAAGPIADSFRSPESVGVIRLMALSIAIFGFSIVHFISAAEPTSRRRDARYRSTRRASDAARTRDLDRRARALRTVSGHRARDVRGQRAAARTGVRRAPPEPGQ